MKRYVKELAHDLKSPAPLLSVDLQHNASVDRIVSLCDRGFITSEEAAGLLLDAYRAHKTAVLDAEKAASIA